MNKNIARQLQTAKRVERKRIQDIHKPMVIPNKKKEYSKTLCRRRTIF